MSTTKEIGGLKDITTIEELREYLESPGVAGSFPTEHDGRHLVERVSSDDPTISKLNWCRPLDHIHSTRVVCRNVATIGTGKSATGDVSVLLIGLPTPQDLFKKLWPKVPAFIQVKITRWAKLKSEGPIANEIRDYVKQALDALPIPIPSFFINSVANVAIPPLVKYILGALGSATPNFSELSEAPIFVHHTPKSLDLLKDHDRKILVGAGLQPHYLPGHLSPSLAPHTDDSPAFPNILSQPDDQDCRTALTRFYQDDFQNGHRPLDLAQVVEIQIRINPASDQDAQVFGTAVWKTLDADTKTKLEKAAKAVPVDKASIGDILYTPICDLLDKSPYDVPTAIIDTFASFKTLEVIEWVLDIHCHASEPSLF